MPYNNIDLQTNYNELGNSGSTDTQINNMVINQIDSTIHAVLDHEVSNIKSALQNKATLDNVKNKAENKIKGALHNLENKASHKMQEALNKYKEQAINGLANQILKHAEDL